MPLWIWVAIAVICVTLGVKQSARQRRREVCNQTGHRWDCVGIARSMAPIFRCQRCGQVVK